MPTAKSTASRIPAKAPEPTDPWERLRAPFPQDEIEKKPQILDRNDQRKSRCENTERGRYVSADGHYCGGWHSRAVHLDYVGHAGITMRLNEVVGPDGWEWEPVAVDEAGLPLHARGEFWIKLTVLGVTKYGVGDNYRGSKEAIGDALRNAAMRFGIGTYLWSKSDRAASLAQFTEPEGEAPEPSGQPLAQQSPASDLPVRGDGGESAASEAGPGGTSTEAQALADTAKRVRSMNTLRNVHGEAMRKNLLAASVAHPTSGEVTTLGMYLNERKAEFEQEPERKAG